jgi:hypothetical protein
MKKIIVLFLVLGSQMAYCQDWIKYYGYGHQPYSYYCLEHYDRGYLLAGDIQNIHYGWLVKTDVNGNVLWDKKIGNGSSYNSISCVERANENGLIISGGTTQFNSPNFDPFIIKLNKCGELEWCRVLVLDNENDGDFGVKPTLDGGYILGGLFFGNNPYDRIRMFKFDSIGELVWIKIYNRTANINSEAIQTMYADDSTILLTGSAYTPNWLRPYFIETDTAGNEKWRLVYSQHTDTSYVGEAWTTVKSRTGNYYSAARRENYPELLKFSGQGSELMNRDLMSSMPQFGGTSKVITMLDDTTIIIDGSWASSSTNGYWALFKTDTLGNPKTTKYLPDPTNSGSSWITKTFDNKILLFGLNDVNGSTRLILLKFNSDLEYDSVYTRHFIYDSLCPHPIVSDTIVPSCVVVGIDEPFKNPETAALKVYPNPAGGIVTVEFPKHLVIKNGSAAFGSTTVYERWKSTTLEVYDLSGKRILQQEVVRAQTTMEFDVSAWHGGMYYFRLSFKGQTVAGEKVVVNTGY